MMEFALLSPILILVVLGLADVARAVYYYNVISNASREGAREAILTYNQCQNTAPCTAPPAGTSVVGVEPAIRRAGAGLLTYQFNDTTTPQSTAQACTPQPNQGCVWVLIVNGTTITPSACSPPNPLSAGGTDTWSECDFNQSKEGGHDVVVEIAYKFAPLTPLVSNVMGNKIIVWAKSEMRTEY
jgi:hypothetical protein